MSQIKKGARKLRTPSSGEDRIRTCGGRNTLNGLANRRFRPLSHLSGYICEMGNLGCAWPALIYKN